MIELNKIYNEDCLEGMKRIPNGSVDCIVCDLPYGVLNKQSEGGGWDSIIPLNSLWEQYQRITKPNAAIILFGQGMFTAKLMMSNEKTWRYNITWDKCRTTGFLNAKKLPLKQTEIISVFYNGQPTYHPQMRKCLPHERNHSRGRQEKEQTNRCYGNFGKADDVITDEKYVSVADGAAAYQKKEGLSGKVTVGGSSSVTPVMQKLAEAYMAVNPGVTVEVEQSDLPPRAQRPVCPPCQIARQRI